MSDAEDDAVEQLRRRVLDALGDAVAGSDWSPPAGGFITEAVVVMIWMQPDGNKGMSYIPATNHWWSTYGMLHDALRRHGDVEGEDD